MASIIRILKLRQSAFKFLGMATNRISTSSKVNEKVMEDLKANPYYDKYAGKIAALQLESPEEFQSRLESNDERKKPKSEKAKERPFTTVASIGKPKLETSPFTKPKLLDDIMKTELLKDKSADEVKQIWLDYHKDKDVIVSIIPKETYKVMKERGSEFSTFLLPIPRGQGYEFILLQILGNEYHFTPLIAYQTHKENAPECLTIICYPELEDEKGIVLMKGEYNPDILNCQEAQCLANELQLYYAQNNEKRLRILERFTYKPNEFDHMDLIAELECLSL